MSLRVRRAMPPMPGCGGPSRVRMALKVSGREGRTMRDHQEVPSSAHSIPGDTEDTELHVQGLCAPLTCSQGPVPDERPPDLPRGVSGCHKRHMQLFCPKEPQRQPRHCPPHPTDLEQRDKRPHSDLMQHRPAERPSSGEEGICEGARCPPRKLKKGPWNQMLGSKSWLSDLLACDLEQSIFCY